MSLHQEYGLSLPNHLLCLRQNGIQKWAGSETRKWLSNMHISGLHLLWVKSTSYGLATAPHRDTVWLQHHTRIRSGYSTTQGYGLATAPHRDTVWLQHHTGIRSGHSAAWGCTTCSCMYSAHTHCCVHAVTLCKGELLCTRAWKTGSRLIP